MSPSKTIPARKNVFFLQTDKKPVPKQPKKDVSSNFQKIPVPKQQKMGHVSVDPFHPASIKIHPSLACAKIPSTVEAAL